MIATRRTEQMLPAIIPIYRKPEQVEKCLATLKVQTIPVEPWIQDNNVTNVGFTKAINHGLRRAIREGCAYAILMNQDCYLRPDAAQRMVAFMDEHPRCAIGGVKQLWSQVEDQIIHAGCTQAFPGGKNIRGRVSAGECATSARVAWVNGACTIARLDAVIEFGLMDENMTLIGSDSDWCYSARLRHWEIWYIADAVVVHDTGVSGQPSEEAAKIMIQDMSYWRDKWVGSQAYNYLSTRV
jgi:GT2 family glycosyltransferase